MDKRRILIADDEAGFTRLLKLHLEQTGIYDVETVNRGSDVLQAARAFKPDLVLLDVIMPDLDGSRVASQLQADPVLRRTPLIFLTAIVSREEVASPVSIIGGCAFIPKPATAEEVIECLEKHFREGTTEPVGHPSRT